VIDLDALFEVYVDQVEAEAKRVFEESVVPFCKERGWRFLAGHGTHTFHNDAGKNHEEQHVWSPSYPNDEALQTLEELLNADVPGLPANSFGSLMPCYYGEQHAQAD